MYVCFVRIAYALDGAYINIHVRIEDIPRYRTKKDTLAMDVLGARAPNLEFTYVLRGCEGSHDSHVL